MFRRRVVVRADGNIGGGTCRFRRPGATSNDLFPLKRRNSMPRSIVWLRSNIERGKGASMGLVELVESLGANTTNPSQGAFTAPPTAFPVPNTVSPP